MWAKWVPGGKNQIHKQSEEEQAQKSGEKIVSSLRKSGVVSEERIGEAGESLESGHWIM